jgi:hypothetical protein
MMKFLVGWVLRLPALATAGMAQRTFVIVIVGIGLCFSAIYKNIAITGPSPAQNKDLAICKVLKRRKMSVAGPQ